MDILLIVLFVIFAVVFVALTPGNYRPRVSK